MITLEKAKKAIIAAQKKASELGIKISVAIVDDHGTIIALEKMDGAFTVSPNFAISKAYTSGTLGYPTETLAQFAVEGKPYFGIANMSKGKFNIIAGGLPIKDSTTVIGGIGVGGSADVKQDVLCAQEGLNVFTQ